MNTAFLHPRYIPERLNEPRTECHPQHFDRRNREDAHLPRVTGGPSPLWSLEGEMETLRSVDQETLYGPRPPTCSLELFQLLALQLFNCSHDRLKGSFQSFSKHHVIRLRSQANSIPGLVSRYSDCPDIQLLRHSNKNNTNQIPNKDRARFTPIPPNKNVCLTRLSSLWSPIHTKDRCSYTRHNTQSNMEA